MATTQLVSDPPTVEPLGRRFAVHLGGVGLANLADGIVLGGVPLIAVMLTRSPGEVSLLQVAFWLPWLLFGLVAGVVIDRADRRHVQLVAAGVRAALLALLTWLAVTDQITMPLLIGAVGIYGVTQVFVDLAGSSIIPQLAPRSRLSAANGRVMGMEQALTTFVGGPLAGLLLAIGAGWVFGVPVALGVAFLLLIGLGLRGDYRAERADDVPAASSRAAEILEGLRFQLGHAVLRPLLVSGSVFNFASTGYFAVFVLWMVGPESQVGLEPHEFPLLVAVLAVGAVAGSAAAERLGRRFAEVRLLVACWGTNAVLLAVPVLWPHPAPIAAAFFALGFTNMVGNVVSRTLRQRLVPAATLGRVGGAGGMIAYGLMPLGALLAGVVGELWGLPAVFLGAVAICLTTVVYVGTQLSDGLVRSFDPQPS